MISADHARERILAAPSADGWSFDPVPLIRAANALAGSDRAAAHAVLRDCAVELLSAPASGLAPPLSNVVLVALALFEPDDPAAGLPAPAFGAPDLALPAPGPGLERLPLLLEAQAPFLLVGGYRIGGVANVQAWLERCAAAGHPRPAPLMPEASAVDALDALTSSDRWRELVPADHHPRVLAMVRAQALRATGDAPAGPDMTLADDERWEDAASPRRRMRWDPAEERFAPG